MAGVESLLGQGAVPLWTNRFDGPGNDYANAIAVDQDGNIVVAGYSYSPLGADPSHSDYLTVAYSNGGQFLWSNRYHGPAYGDNAATAVTVGKNGDVFVTGNAGTIAYSSSGVPLWTNRSASAAAIALDSIGNVFTTGSKYGTGYSDWITVALSPEGTPLWTNRTGLGYDDFAKSVAVDRFGNVLVAGSWTWPTSFYDFTLVKYSPDGVALWTNHFDAPWNDFLEGMAVGNDGTVFLTGQSARSGVFESSVYDFMTIAYSANGTLLWTNRYNGPANAADFPAAIKLDNEGNVIVTGESAGEAYGLDYATVKYSSTGAPLWTNRFHRLGSVNNRPTALAVDKDNDVVVTGSSYSDGYNDFATVVYSSAGVPIWTNVYSGPVANADDVAQAVTTDAGGNVFVTGFSWGTTGSDFATVKYSAGPEGSLRIHNVENQAVLTWSNPGFSLQSAPFMTGTFTNISGASSPYTNSVTGPQQFFRLIAN